MARKVELRCEGCGSVLATFRKPISEQMESESEIARTARAEDVRWMNWLIDTDWSADWKAGYEDLANDYEAGKYSGNLLRVARDWSADNGGGSYMSGFTVNCACGRTVRGKIWNLEKLVDPKFETKKRVAVATLRRSVL